MASAADVDVPVGLPVPARTPYAISVSLPTWSDNVGYAEGERRVTDAMICGYPRFVVPVNIRQLARIAEQKFGKEDESCLLFPAQSAAEACQAFFIDRSSKAGATISPRIGIFAIEAEYRSNGTGVASGQAEEHPGAIKLHMVFFPTSSSGLAKQFWQHSGLGISGRLADYCLSKLPDTQISALAPPNSVNSLPRGCLAGEHSIQGRHDFSAYRHYQLEYPTQPGCPLLKGSPLASESAAKSALRRRIAGFFRTNVAEERVHLESHSVWVPVTDSDVYLYPTGMAAIWTTYHICLSRQSGKKSVCFGFPYTDTLKVLEKWGPGCTLFAEGDAADIEKLELMLEAECSRDPGRPPINALFTEFPSNPLLRSFDMRRLRALADKYDFPIVIDQTVGNFKNVEVLPYADVLVTSLSKIFSGYCNVMGGSLVLNPEGRYYQALQTHLEKSYEDLYFGPDAIQMELNSRDFASRIHTIDANAEAACDFLRSRSLVAEHPPSTAVILDIYYPKYTTRSVYDAYRAEGAGYGGLISLKFTNDEAAHVFYDALQFYKGPSLGTNFTLVCPYTILAHYRERDWAAEHGVNEGLVRISVGMEDKDELLSRLERALLAAEVDASHCD